MSKLDFEETNYGNDFQAVCGWPKGWPHEDGGGEFDDVWFKAYDTSLCENDEDKDLFGQGFLFNCIVHARYYTPSLYCEDRLAKFAARTREEAERLFQAAADALYEG